MVAYHANVHNLPGRGGRVQPMTDAKGASDTRTHLVRILVRKFTLKTYIAQRPPRTSKCSRARCRLDFGHRQRLAVSQLAAQRAGRGHAQAAPTGPPSFTVRTGRDMTRTFCLHSCARDAVNGLASLASWDERGSMEPGVPRDAPDLWSCDL